MRPARRYAPRPDRIGCGDFFSTRGWNNGVPPEFCTDALRDLAMAVGAVANKLLAKMVYEPNRRGIAMKELRPNVHRTRREVARMGVVLTSAAITALVATRRGLARDEDRHSQEEDRHSHGENRNSQNGGGSMHGAPAPAIGSGLSTLMVVAGLLLGAKLFRRRGQGGTAPSVSD
jgi:hypothetical protein